MCANVAIYLPRRGTGAMAESWKPALDAFAITFADRSLPAETTQAVGRTLERWVAQILGASVVT